MMKGILFKPWKIKAIADSPLDKVWQTRRVIKPQPDNLLSTGGVLVGWVKGLQHTHGFEPRYQVGETVYIKEAYAHFCNYFHQGDAFASVEYSDSSVEKRAFTGDPPKQKWWNTGKPVGYMQNPRTMPAWAARYFIKITDVRAERLQEISLADIYAEGCPLEAATIFTDPMSGYETNAHAYEWYHDLWDTINKPPYDWRSNPWVFVYSFVKVDEFTPPINQSSEGQGINE